MTVDRSAGGSAGPASLVTSDRLSRLGGGDESVNANWQRLLEAGLPPLHTNIPPTASRPSHLPHSPMIITSWKKQKLSHWNEVSWAPTNNNVFSTEKQMYFKNLLDGTEIILKFFINILKYIWISEAEWCSGDPAWSGDPFLPLQTFLFIFWLLLRYSHNERVTFSLRQVLSLTDLFSPKQ